MLSRMVPPSQHRPAYLGGILQIHITRACDKSCFHCTQASNIGGKPVMMKPAEFRIAVESLRNYFGVVGIFGGNPTISPYFEEICEILREVIPYERRGLWSDHPLGKGKICAETFNPAHSNINVHLDQQAHDEWLRDWPQLAQFAGPNRQFKGIETDSRHGPPFVAQLDVGLSQDEINANAATCDVNQFWSALIGVFRGQVLGFVCELMFAQATLHENDPDWPVTGFPVDQLYDGKQWWELPMEAFAEQVRFHCGRCGMPLRGEGQLAMGGDREQVSQTHAPWYRPKDRNRPVELVTTLDQLKPGSLPVATNYILNTLPIIQ